MSVPSTIERSAAFDGDRGTSGFSWSRAVVLRRDQVFGSGLRTWLVVLATIVLVRSMIALTRSEHASIVPVETETVLAIATIAAALAFAISPSEREGSPARASVLGVGLTLVAAAVVSMGALHDGFGVEVMHAVVIIMMVGLPMLMPLPLRYGVPSLAAIAGVYPAMQLSAGTARWDDPLLAAQVVDLAAGFGMATLCLVLHNLLFASRWRALRDLAGLAEHDGLTGIHNRRAFGNRLLSETNHASRYGTSIGLVMFDIDGFKRFNTEAGYAAGDAMLRAVSETIVGMTEQPRYRDLGCTVARYGGEEFVIIAPGADEETLRTLADETCRSIAALRVPFERGEPLRVTVSAGHAHSSGGDEVSPSRLLEAADAALYRAKVDGGDRAYAAGDEDESADGSAGRFVVRRPQPQPMSSTTAIALSADSVHIHGLVVRWMFAVTAVWVGLLALMDLAFAHGRVYDFSVGPVVAGRLTIVAALGVLARYSSHLRWWHRHLTTLHAAFVVVISAAIIWTMEQAGGLTSAYFGQLVYVAAAWALAISAPPAVSLAVLFGVTVSIPLFFGAYHGVSAIDHAIIVRTAVLAGAGAVALGTQSVFSRLRAEEVSARAALSRLARLDPLTGLPNRVAFQDRLRRWIRRADPSAPLAVAIVDIDHFKGVNDTHGHVAGDEVLVRVGHTIGESVRSSDLAARLGGEEFAIAMPMTDCDGAARSVERIREAIHSLELLDGTVTLTASAGVACTDGSESLDTVLSRADDALRAAKAEGRDRAVFR